MPNLRTAEALLASGRAKTALSICVEVCSAAFYVDDDPGVLISTCLFGDGAGAAVLSNEPSLHQRNLKWQDAESLLSPGDRDALRFETRDGMLRNILTVPVPGIAARQSRQVFERVLERNGLRREQISGWIWHSGGRDVLAALRGEFGFANGELDHTATCCANTGTSAARAYITSWSARSRTAHLRDGGGCRRSAPGSVATARSSRRVDVERVIEPEWLDDLPADDPRARRSRGDLRASTGS